MEKLPPSIVFDYLKGIVYKLQNDFEELKTKQGKQVAHDDQDEDVYFILKEK